MKCRMLGMLPGTHAACTEHVTFCPVACRFVHRLCPRASPSRMILVSDSYKRCIQRPPSHNKACCSLSPTHQTLLALSLHLPRSLPQPPLTKVQTRSHASGFQARALQPTSRQLHAAEVRSPFSLRLLLQLSQSTTARIPLSLSPPLHLGPSRAHLRQPGLSACSRQKTHAAVTGCLQQALRSA